MSKVLEVQNLKKTFYNGKTAFQAVRGVSFQVEQGQCFGLVGESGSGKSTIAKMITLLEKPDDGKIFLNGREITCRSQREKRHFYREMQMVFQTPADSFNPRICLGRAVMEPMLHYGFSKAAAKERMYELLERVGLDEEYAKRYPHQVSGGECQRAAIARAVSVNPRLLICDEATSALDVSVQEQIAKLLLRLKEEWNLSILLISHDLALVQQMCDYMAVMQEGSVVEEGIPDKVIEETQNPYTRLLVDSVFPMDPDSDWKIPEDPWNKEKRVDGEEQ